jgi:uncharacterized protein GlcG (DUF336 family)
MTGFGTGRKAVAAAGLAAALATAGGAVAQDGAMRPAMSRATSHTIVEGCEAWAAANGVAFAIAVFDEGGNLAAFARMDGVAVAIGEVAQWKGRAAARTGIATAAQAGILNGLGAAAAGAPELAGVQGGLPVMNAEGVVLGGAGASGASPQQDEDCVRAGIEAAGYAGSPPSAR